ncbi:hypothetical protein NQ318_015945 [Aromia moschata]|uniref:Uncharacterized protein n=1 Tax=Aromia moschata TaxID=1265417 RepID=A0AAV8XR05_9CUCU|nr:hypothetical protein NQ318_015945 [Aromia moschata]
MELRSSRSRSKTPLTQIDSFDKELIEKGNHVEKTVTRTTRRTTMVRHIDNTASSTDEVTSVNIKPVRRSLRSEKNVRKIFKTSDYSSEDGENEVSSTRTISQNDKNQLIEDARAAANGTSEVSALDLYKKSGRYWEYANTDLYGASRSLFNNNYDSDYEVYEKKSYSVSRWSRFRRSIVSVIMSVVTVFFYVYDVQTAWLAKLHKFTSRVMLLDTWLLWKSGGGNKSAKLVALCLIPLLLLGGLHVLLASGISLAPSCHPNCGRIASTYINSYISATYKYLNFTES